MERTTYELKYCERCGSLGLRRSQSLETYCEPCAEILLNYALPGRMIGRKLFGQPATRFRTPLQLKAGSPSGPALGRLQ
jgi:hypothetical protein